MGNIRQMSEYQLEVTRHTALRLGAQETAFAIHREQLRRWREREAA